MNITAKLNNTEIWIPLQANSINTQIMNLSLKSDFVFNKTLDINGSDSYNYIHFNINHFLVAMIYLTHAEMPLNSPQE